MVLIEKIQFEILGIKDGLVYVNINGEHFAYEPIRMSPEKLLELVNSRLQRGGVGDALKVFSNNANHIYGGSKMKIIYKEKERQTGNNRTRSLRERKNHTRNQDDNFTVESGYIIDENNDEYLLESKDKICIIKRNR